MSHLEGAARAVHRARQMVVQRNDDEARTRAFSGRSGLWLHRGSYRYGCHSKLSRECLGVPARRAAHEERNFFQFLFGFGAPDRLWPADGVLIRTRRCGALGGGRAYRLDDGAAQMRRRCAIVEFGVFAEHRQQMLFEAHHQRMNPGVEHHIRAFETHLRRISGREILNVQRRGDDGAGNAEPLGDVALHLGAENEFRLQFGDLRLDFEIVVGDERFGSAGFGLAAHLAGELPRIGSQDPRP